MKKLLRKSNIITESQNHRMVGVGRDLCGSSSPTQLPKQSHLQQAAQDLVQAGLEYLQRRRIHNLSGQPVPVLCHPQREEVLHCPAGAHFYHSQKVPIFPLRLETWLGAKASSPWARTGTIDNDGSRGAPALGHNVLGHASVISRVQEPGLLDDEVVIDGDKEVGVLRGIDDILIPQPLHLAMKRKGWGNDGD